MTKQIVIAGGGIGGLSLALSLQQIGITPVVFESVSKLQPLGVGINLQPNAVRELMEMGISRSDLDSFGVSAKEWALVGINGKEIYAEQRGEYAGYKWPQYAAHRGLFHMFLYQRFKQLVGKQYLKLGCRVTGYQKQGNGRVKLTYHQNGQAHSLEADILIGADGIHSKIRAEMHPHQPAIHWGGSIMWRGTSLAKPLRTTSSFIGLGNHRQRMVIYPISGTDENTGLALINWIAEVSFDEPSTYEKVGWYRQVTTDDFLPYFADWKYDWLDVPALISKADAVFENPMIDRDPISTWTDGPVALLGDAAHPMFPTGSNGASQAIIDGRVLCAKFLEFGVCDAALDAYNAQLCDPISKVVLTNRNDGPFGLLKIIDERCGGVFDTIDEVISETEKSDFMRKYKEAAGFAKDRLNAARPTVPVHKLTSSAQV